MLDPYPFTSNDDHTSYFFDSIGKRGVVPKVIDYVLLQNNIYNVGIQDLDPTTNERLPPQFTGNGDAMQVFVTAVETMKVFFKHYPDKWLFLEPLNSELIKLYHRGMLALMGPYADDIHVYGIVQEGEYEPYREDGTYRAILIGLQEHHLQANS
ncbi:DUF6934 family protein [Spirosoma montaniterrae]|uniref:Uncharacterized protein n=1 Tax=Spirosoma montaniterrae TaxID=1178516 RepID=A0A1P9WZR5_9BACT|nr:hypothetical protein [Spirosoma montaniterrae]AQG80854.1 hypothetical protein AWR27_16930 [Spirosoma montaniterrae]